MNPKTLLAPFAALVLAMPACVCAPGEADCSDECVDLDFDESNCGRCGRTCRGGVCLDGECVASTSTGMHCAADEACDDGNFCNGQERCVAERCRGSSPPVCSDGIDCTDESCSPTDGCISTPDDDACAPGSTCTALQAPGSGCEP